MLTVAEAALRLHISQKIVRGWIKEGRLVHYRMGAKGKRGKILIKEEDLDLLLESLKVVANVPKPIRRSPKPIVLKHIKLS